MVTRVVKQYAGQGHQRPQKDPDPATSFAILTAIVADHKEKMGLSMYPNHLIHEPYAVFRYSVSPAGLYARQKWLKKSATDRWKTDFADTVADLYQGQSADGLWRGSPIETIHRLFGLHLTVRHPDPPIDKGLDALLGISLASESEGYSDYVPAARLRGLPFTHGERAAVIVPATLFLCAIFGRSGAPSVLTLYNRVARRLDTETLSTVKPATVHNLLRSFVVHPIYANEQVTQHLVEWMNEHQTRQGDWGPGIPFYQALNALAHLDTPAANRQTEQAFEHLFTIQSADGTWGPSERQWCTFLAVHALRNKGIV